MARPRKNPLADTGDGPVTLEALNSRSRGMDPQTGLPNAQLIALGKEALFSADDEQPEPPEDDEGEPSQLETIMDMLGGMSGDGAMLHLFRRDGMKGMQFCTQYTPEQFDHGGLDMIRSAWGAGDYSLHIRGPIGNGNRKGIIRKIPLSIATAPPGSTQTAPQSQSSDLAAVLQSIQESNARTQEILVTMANKPQADPMQQMMGMFTLMKGMREAMGIEGGPAKAEEPSILKLAKEMRAMKELAGEFGGGGKQDDESLISLAGPIVKMVSEQMQTRNNVPAVAVPAGMQAQPVSLIPRRSMPLNKPMPVVDTTQPASVPIPQPESETDMNIQLQFALFEIERQARAAKNDDGTFKPEIVAQLAQTIADKAPDEFLEILENEQWFDFITQDSLAPKLKEHEAFLRAVHVQVMAILDAWDAEEQSAEVDANDAEREVTGQG